MKTKQFKLPQIESYEVDIEKSTLVYEKMKSAQAVMTFIKSSPTDYQFYFSGFGENEFAMLLILMGRNSQVHDFFKAAVVNTELYKNDELEGFDYSYSAIEYMKENKI